MKFKYDFNDNYYNLFNEAQGIVTFRSEMEKDPYKVDTFTGKCFDIFKVIALVFIVSVIFNLINSEWFISEFLFLLFAILAAFLFGLIIVFVISYLQQKNVDHSGEVKFDKNGIFDSSNSGVRVGIDWSLIDLVVVKDKVIVLLSKSNFYFNFDEELIDDVLKAVNKYHKDVRIIDCSINRYQQELQKEVIVKNEEIIKKLEEERLEKESQVKVEKITGVMIEPPNFDKLNPITEEVVDMDKDTIKEIIIPPFNEDEESTEE